jgi:hypothetical protein
MPESRNWDRSDESPKDKRFHDLRESGYRGPIDQDGYAVSDKTAQRREEEARRR